jgi:hypothetical protein
MTPPESTAKPTPGRPMALSFLTEANIPGVRGLAPGPAAGVETRGEPISRILSRGLPPLDDHSSAAPVARAVKLPTRAPGPARVRPLFGIAPGGACHTVPVARSVVGSYPTVSPLPCKQGSLFSVALSLGLPPPGVTRHPCFMESGLSSGHLRTPRSSSPPRKVRGKARFTQRQSVRAPLVRFRSGSACQTPAQIDPALRLDAGTGRVPRRFRRASACAPKDP